MRRPALLATTLLAAFSPRAGGARRRRDHPAQATRSSSNSAAGSPACSGPSIPLPDRPIRDHARGRPFPLRHRLRRPDRCRWGGAGGRSDHRRRPPARRRQMGHHRAAAAFAVAVQQPERRRADPAPVGRQDRRPEPARHLRPQLATTTTLDGELRDYTQVQETETGTTTVHLGHYDRPHRLAAEPATGASTCARTAGPTSSRAPRRCPTARSCPSPSTA